MIYYYQLLIKIEKIFLIYKNLLHITVMMKCNRCFDNQTCRLITDLSDGYCKNCCKCSISGCKNRVQYRIYWTVITGDIECTLYKDVCCKHKKYENLTLANNDLPKWVEKFTYSIW